jgi:FAD/FMN-containing dehydrogenase
MDFWLSRRRFLQFLATAPVAVACGSRAITIPGVAVEAGARVDDVFSHLNPTHVRGVVRVDSALGVQRAVAAARAANVPIAVAGGRHALGGQQFVTGGWVLDTRELRHVRNFDTVNGLLLVDAGMVWTEVLAFLSTTWEEDGQGWTILQKPIGADRTTIGGSLSANIHGHPIAYPPFVADVERFMIVGADGPPQAASRRQNQNLFRMAIGGYGLMGVVTEVTLRLIRRGKVERVVNEDAVENVVVAMRDRASDGHLYGEFLLSPNHESFNDFLRRGVLTTWSPVPIETPIDPPSFPEETLRELLFLAHTDPYTAMRTAINLYVATNGRVEWTDQMQMGGLGEGYHQAIDEKTQGPPGTDVITEIFVPRDQLTSFLAAARALLREGIVPLVHAAVRLTEADEETFLPWAKDRFACVTFHFHVPRSQAEVDRAAAAFRELVAEALERGGSFHLTYPRWATREQIEAAYPRFAEFLRLKRVYDPEERFQSDWYRHYRRALDA